MTTIFHVSGKKAIFKTSWLLFEELEDSEGNQAKEQMIGKGEFLEIKKKNTHTHRRKKLGYFYKATKNIDSLTQTL